MLLAPPPDQIRSNHCTLVCMPIIKAVIKYSTVWHCLSFVLDAAYYSRGICKALSFNTKSVFFSSSSSLHIFTRNNSLSIFLLSFDSLPFPFSHSRSIFRHSCVCVCVCWRVFFLFILTPVLFMLVYYSRVHNYVLHSLYSLNLHIFASQTTLSSYKLLYYFHV